MADHGNTVAANRPQEVAFENDRQAMLGHFVTFTTYSVVAIVVLLVLMAIFLV